MITEFFHGALLDLLVGAAAGFLSGLFGIGGGVIVVPSLLYIFQGNQYIPAEQLMRFAVGTSLAIMLFTSLISIRSHKKLETLFWSAYQRLWFGLVVGVLLGSIVADFASMDWLKTLFGVFLLFIAWKMVFGMGQRGPGCFPSWPINWIITFGIGFLSSLLGVGGGTLIIPYLTYCGVDPRKITAVTLLCSLTIALLGTAIFMITGSYALNDSPMTSMTLGYIYLPAVFWITIPSMLFAPLGAKLTYVIPVNRLRYAFVVLLLITAVDLLI